MPARADVMVAEVAAATSNTASTNYLVETTAGVLYCVYVDSGADVAFKKSTDGGLTWSAATVVFAGTVTQLSIWFDRWSGIAAGLIHCAYTESATDDTLYRTIDTASSDALSTQTTIFAGASTAAGCHLSITRARGGNVYCKTVIDAGAEGGFYRLPNANVPNGAWDAARTVDETIATGDQMILVPGFAADDQDIMAIFWDASANEISRKVYDDSANTWAETSIATSMTEQDPANNWPDFAVAVDLTNSRIVLVAWSGTGTANADLRCWKITESAITETSANVVLNSTGGQGMCAISIDSVTGYWLVFYGGKSGGSETFNTSINVYCKGSTDGGATWSPETLVTNAVRNTRWLITVPWRYIQRPLAAVQIASSPPEIKISVCLTQPQFRHAIGM